LRTTIEVVDLGLAWTSSVIRGGRKDLSPTRRSRDWVRATSNEDFGRYSGMGLPSRCATNDATTSEQPQTRRAVVVSVVEPVVGVVSELLGEHLVLRLTAAPVVHQPSVADCLVDPFSVSEGRCKTPGFGGVVDVGVAAGAVGAAGPVLGVDPAGEDEYSGM